MIDYYKSKLNDPETIIFRCEKGLKERFRLFCDVKELNESAVLRRMLADFLNKNEGENK